MDFIEEIQEAEERLRLAMLSSDVNELEKILSDDLVFTSHTGDVISKQDDLAGHKSGDLKIESLTLSDSKILPVGDAVVVSVKAEILGTYKGNPANANFRFTRVWGKLNRDWQVMAGHSCIIPF